MKTSRTHPLVTTTLAALLVGLLPGTGAQAAITGINSVNSSAQINFDDTNSFNPVLPGSNYTGLPVTPWNGSTVSFNQTDSTTSDFATGTIEACVSAVNPLCPAIYDVSFNSITLSQAPPNTGFAVLQYIFSIEFQTDINGLASQPTLYPNFLVNGTIQPGGFASVVGQIYYATNDGANHGYEF